MPLGIYYSLRDRYLNILSKHYIRIATPVEAPSKSSFGDIDILVSEPRPPHPTSPPDSLSNILSTDKVITTPKSATSSFAVPYPNLAGKYVQLDVHVCPPSTFDWQVFHQSHGDLWNLLGTTIRPFGLTANDAGLHLRIPEIEELNRKRSMIFLTCEPNDVLSLLGLDTETYSTPFESVEAMYEYVVGCRFFRGETYVRGDLKANDRKRLAQRELFRRFVDIWLPQNECWVETRIGREPTLMREDVCELALERFGKRQEYEERVSAWRNERRELIAKQEGREKRKANAVELEEYTNAWTKWLEANRQKSTPD